MVLVQQLFVQAPQFIVVVKKIENNIEPL